MTQIPKTKFATSPSPLNLCSGFALFPGVGTFRAGISISEKTTDLFNNSGTFLSFKASTYAGVQLFMGLCGPSYAVELELEGNTDDRTINLVPSNDTVQAGLFLGLTARAYLNIKIQEHKTDYWIDWGGVHANSYWVTINNLNIDHKFDLIFLLEHIILLLLQEEGKKDTFLQTVNEISPSLLGSYGMFDQQSGQIAAQGSAQPRPTFNLTIDIAPEIPGMAAVITALKALWSRVTVNVGWGLQVPVTVTLTKVTLDNTATYPLNWDGQSFVGIGDLPPDTLQTMDIELTHSPGFDIALVFGMNVNFFKAFNIGQSFAFPLFKLLGIDTAIGDFQNTLCNTIGSTSVGPETCSLGSDFKMVDVIFETAEA